VLLAILCVLLAVLFYVARNVVVKDVEDSRVDATKIQLAMLSQDLQRFKLDLERYPTNQEGIGALFSPPSGTLKEWRGPYAEEKYRLDKWERPIAFEAHDNTFSLTSAGPNGKFHDEDDISSDDM
jgi:general secretion pathway protein G